MNYLEVDAAVLGFTISRYRVLKDVDTELRFANSKFPNVYTSPHEGFAILAEEVDELWEAVKNGQKPRLFGTSRESEDALAAIRKEAIQVAAMACRLIEDLDSGAFSKETAKR